MVLKLNWRERKSGFGETSLDVPSGMALVIETTPGGEEIFSVVTPAGKTINYNIKVVAVESDI